MRWLLPLLLVAGLHPAELPVATPAATAGEWLSAPAQAERRGLDQARSTAAQQPSGVPWGKIGAGVVTVLGLAFGLAKTVSASNPLAQLTTTIGQAAFDLIAHRSAKQDAAVATGALDALHQVAARLDPRSRAAIAQEIVRSVPVAALPAAQVLLDRLDAALPVAGAVPVTANPTV